MISPNRPAVKHRGVFMKLSKPAVKHRDVFMKLSKPAVRHRGVFMKLGKLAVKHRGVFMKLSKPAVKHRGVFMKLNRLAVKHRMQVMEPGRLAESPKSLFPFPFRHNETTGSSFNRLNSVENTGVLSTKFKEIPNGPAGIRTLINPFLQFQNGFILLLSYLLRKQSCFVEAYWSKSYDYIERPAQQE